ncbi:MAG TPA: SDR family NAD(P)-dependent oxidoreductase [Aliidongia sp.]|uniref:SDR family NAD(P)-dependent oxidoreductase n=1 Tax=Aliidongia sp. TaxID=1914230 RepID=UPI002DDD167A|nr:SDR family NAD(P)-dependent oxidoreductase [Aliidongia sp.]HEV2673583.1 SDR family NAD(P)-dependent oxidoreductase [Aliidongia sp.]
MSFDFTGKRVVVAGGSKGIGRSIALGFAAAGAKVSICARGEAALAKAREELSAFGTAAHAASCDLGVEAQVKAYIAEAAEALGGIDVLINNASGFGQSDDEAGWAASLNVDLMATVRASHAAVPFLVQATGSSIVNVSSIAGYRPTTRSVPYAAVKAAVIQYTTSQAAQLARQGVRVNCVAPGSIEFPGGTWEDRRTSNPDLYGRTLKSIPFGRLGYPEEIADVVLFLASPLARWVTGQTITADGGQLLGVS